MRRSSLLILSVAVMVLVAANGSPAFAAPSAVTNIGDIIANSTKMNGQEVRIVGEAIGDIMVRGDYAWLNVLDSSATAIGVYLPKAEALKVTRLGDYNQTGDVVELTGVFHNACVEHGGDPDVHAESLSVVKQGVPTPHPVDVSRVIFAGALLAVAGVMGVAVKKKSS